MIVRPTLGDLAISQDNDQVTIVDRAQAMCNKDGCALLFLENAVDVLQKCLFRMCV